MVGEYKTWWVRWEPGTADASLLMQKMRLHCSVVTYDLLSIPGLSNSCIKCVLKGLGSLHALESSAEKNILCSSRCDLYKEEEQSYS